MENSFLSSAGVSNSPFSSTKFNSLDATAGVIPSSMNFSFSDSQIERQMSSGGGGNGTLLVSDEGWLTWSGSEIVEMVYQLIFFFVGAPLNVYALRNFSKRYRFFVCCNAEKKNRVPKIGINSSEKKQNVNCKNDRNL